MKLTRLDLLASLIAAYIAAVARSALTMGAAHKLTVATTARTTPAGSGSSTQACRRR